VWDHEVSDAFDLYVYIWVLFGDTGLDSFAADLRWVVRDEFD